MGLGFNGGELLLLAIGGCYCNDIFRDATKLGFSVVGGEKQANWLILSNDQATIGLFQGMFERNILTFNPGLG